MDKWRSTLAIYNDPWPEDTERRRVAGLQDFLEKYPTYLDTLTKDERNDLVAQANTRFPEAGRTCYGPYPDKTGRTSYGMDSAEDKGHGVSESELQPRKKGNDMPMEVKRMKSTHCYNNENRWDLCTTLELLETMKAYVIRHEVSRVGVRSANWIEVAKSLENPLGIELQKFARSCQVRYDNIRRHLNAGMDYRVDENIRRSVIEYLQICHKYDHCERLRLKSQNKVYRYRRQTRYAYSKVVLQQMHKMKALSKSDGKNSLIPQTWKRNPGSDVEDGDDHSVLAPSENSELENDSGSDEKALNFEVRATAGDTTSPRESRTWSGKK